MKKVKHWLWAFSILLAAAVTGFFYMPVKAAGDVVINSTNFPDDNFRNFISATFDPDGGGTITAAEIKNIKEMDCSFRQISSLKGIKYFTALKTLDCDTNQLTSLDLSNNTALTWLEFNSNPQLNTVNLSKNTKLTYLSCWGTGLTKLDLSKNTALTVLNCSSGQLTSLNLSNNTELKTLNCAFNKLTKLDVSKNSKLTEINCLCNSITTLNLSQNTALTNLACSDNQLSKLDLSHNTKLKILNCGNNKLLTTLDLSKNTALTSLSCYKDPYSEGYMPMTRIDVSKNLALTSLNCWGAGLTELNVSKNTKLKELGCGNNWLTSLNVSKNTSLTSLTCSGNSLTALNVSNNTQLTTLECSGNSLTELDVTKLTKLESFICSNNKLTALDVRKCNALKGLECENNQLTKLDLSKNPTLSVLMCGNNLLTELDISKNKELARLNCVNNKIKTLNIKNNPYISKAYNYGWKREFKGYYEDYYSYLFSYPNYYSLYVGKKVKITAAEPLKPMPIKLSVENNGAVKITWDTYSKAVTYNIYTKSDIGEWVPVSISYSKSPYTDYAHAKPGDPITYTVIPISSDGEELAGYGNGTSISYTTDPVDITLENKPAGVAVSWDKVDNAAKYRIFRKTQGGSWEKVTTTTSLKYTDKKAVYSETYLYSVRAMTEKGNYINRYGNGTKITYILSAPKLTLTNSEDGIEISWKAMSGAAKYNVYVKNEAGKWTRLKTVSDTSYTDKNVVSGVNYTYSVIGYDSSGHAMNENGDGYEIIRNDAFVRPKAASTTEGVLLSWDAFAGAMKYRVYRKNASGKWTKLDTLTGLEYMDATATVNEKNTYAVLAIASDGSNLTDYGKGKSIKFIIPPTPVNAIAKSSYVRLEWGSVVNAEKYQVYRRTKSTDWEKLGTTTGFAYNDKTAVSGKGYYYSVIALDTNKKALNDYGEGVYIKFIAANADAFAEVNPEEIEGLGIAEETEAVVEEDIIEDETTEEETSEEDVIEEETSEEEGSEEDVIGEETSDEEGSDEDAIAEETEDVEGSEEAVIEEETSEEEETEITEDAVEEEILE